MPWVFMRHRAADDNDGGRLKPSLCHPFYYKARMDYIAEKYYGETYDIKRLANCHIDLGGMIQQSDPAVTVQLGKRTVTCWKHHVPAVLALLKRATPVLHRGMEFRKFCRWPGVMCFLSAADVRRITAVLRREIDMVWIAEQRILTRHALIRANTRGANEAEAVCIRSAFQKPLN